MLVAGRTTPASMSPGWTTRPAGALLAIVLMLAAAQRAAACDCSESCSWHSGIAGPTSGYWCKTGSCGTYYDGWAWDNYYWAYCTPCASSCGSCTSNTGSQSCASCKVGYSLSNGVCSVAYSSGCTCSSSFECDTHWGLLGPFDSSVTWCKTQNSCGTYYDGLGPDNYWYARCTPCDTSSNSPCSSCSQEAEPATQRCDACKSGTLSYGNGVCAWDVQAERNGCYIASDCDGQCGPAEQCQDKSRNPLDPCWNKGNSGGWNKYACVDRCFPDDSCGGVCSASAGCSDAGFFNTCFKCTEPNCGPGEYARAGMCYANAPPTPPAPASCPTPIATARSAGVADADPRVQDAATGQRRSVRSLPPRPAGGAGRRLAEEEDDSESSDVLAAVLEEEDDIQRSLLRVPPRATGGVYTRRFRHASALSGDVTVLDYRVTLQHGVTNLQEAFPELRDADVACADAAGGDDVAVTLSFAPAGGAAAAAQRLADLRAALCAGCRVFTAGEPLPACGGAALKHRVTRAPQLPQQDDDHDGAAPLAVLFWAAPEPDADAFINSTALTFFQGSRAGWRAALASGRVLRMDDADDPAPPLEVSAAGAARRRRLLDTLAEDAPVVSGVDVFNVQSRNLYCDGTAVVACSTCRLSGSTDTLVTVDPSSDVSETRASGTLALTLQGLVRLRGAGTTSRTEVPLSQPWCVPPVCYMVSLWNIAYIQVGLRFGLRFVASVSTAAAGDVPLDASAAVTLSLAGRGAGTPALNVAFSQQASGAGMGAGTQALRAAVTASLGVKPVLQVGAWGAGSVFWNALSASFAVYAEGALTASAAFSAAYSAALLPADARLAPVFPACGVPHNLALSAALGVGDSYIVANVSGRVALLGSTATLGPYVFGPTRFSDPVPAVAVWALCASLTPPPAPPPPPSPPLPALPPGAAAPPPAAEQVVSATVRLAGLTAAAFDAAAQTAFRAGVAAVAGAPASAVTILSFADATGAAARRRAVLATTSLQVSFRVAVSGATAAAAAATALNAAVGTGALATALQVAGLAAVSGVSSVAPAAAAAAAPAAPSPSGLSGAQTAVIAGAAGGGGGALVLLGGLACWWCVRRRRFKSAAAGAPPAAFVVTVTAPPAAYSANAAAPATSERVQCGDGQKEASS